MIRKFVFIMSILILISLSCVSANDSNQTDFDSLANDINITPESQTLNLSHDYYLSNASQKHIVIDRPITIDGNDYTIDAPDVSRVFWVKADNVVIKNINFINSKTTGLAGGVISWWGNNGTLENCNFTNNIASSAGGAVSWRGDNGNIANCNFINNTLTTDAHDTFTDGDGFDSESSTVVTICNNGGALNLRGNNISIDYCSFLDNSAEFSGGAVRILGNDTRISNSKFKNNRAGHSGGAVSWQANNVLISGCEFRNNSPKDLFLYSQNIILSNTVITNESSIDSYYGVNCTNVSFGFIRSFEELSQLINATSEGGILVLDFDYEFTGGQNKGILISKPITIDGNGHTLDGNKLSRMFNVTADNVVIKNISFINGNAYGKYFSDDAGGGAIYWNGSNGRVENCNFTGNSGSGVEDDPFDKEEEYVDENGLVYHVIRYRPMGAKINEGGAIVWNGTNGTVLKCIFRNNGVGYPNYGGAICWRGNSGNVLESEFYNNEAWAGAAINWRGDDGTILYSKFINTGEIFGKDILWFGNNGLIKYSFLITSNGESALYPYSGSVVADYNFWGDILPGTKIDTIKSLNNCIVLNSTYNRNFVHAGDPITVESNILLFEKDGGLSDFEGLSISGNITTIADRDGFVQLYFKDGKLDVKIVPKTKIVSKEFKKYYKQSKKFKVRVYGADGKLAIAKSVKFTLDKKVYYSKTDKRGYATLAINKKPGKYVIIVQYDDFKVKKRITVKTTLITKNVSKKAKKEGQFRVKVISSKGKALAKKVVKIKFKGKTYKIKTDKKGIAVFKLSKNLKVGKHTIKTTYNGLTNINKIIVKK